MPFNRLGLDTRDTAFFIGRVTFPTVAVVVEMCVLGDHDCEARIRMATVSSFTGPTVAPTGYSQVSTLRNCDGNAFLSDLAKATFAGPTRPAVSEIR